MAFQMMVDLYGCDKGIIDSLEEIRSAAKKVIADIGAEIVEECFHRFEPVGITYIAVITTSHFSIHTWPENDYAAVDIFSCSEGVPEDIAEGLKKLFKAERVKVSKFERDIKGR